MQESVSMHKSPTPLRQSEEEEKVRERGKKRGRETGKTEARRLMKRKAKNIPEELKQGLNFTCKE